jgi:hypothetical protein
MDILLFLLGAQMVLIAALMKQSPATERGGGSNKGTLQSRGARMALFASGAVLIILGILFRMRRYYG